MAGNAEIAARLREMALFLEMEGVPFKPRAYEKAAAAVASCEQPLHALLAEGGVAALDALPAVGKGIAERIAELLGTGRIADLERLRAATPVDVLALTSVEGLGPKHVKALHDALGVRTLAQLGAACRAGKVRELPHFGARSEEKILRGIALQKAASGRRPLGDAWALAREIEGRLVGLRGVERATIAGSLRRRKETIGDLDFLVVSRDPAPVMKAFVAMSEVVQVYAKGSTKALVRLASGIDADLRVVEAASFGAALAYFTGSKDHNVALRRIAQEQGLKLSEYGVFRAERRIAGRTEEDVYEALGLPWIAPELRENDGEIEAARAGKLPDLLPYGALRGDLQVQTDWTDGAASIEEMVAAARRLGLEYIAITDHTRDLAMAHGSDEKKLREQTAAIRALDAKLRGFRVLSGAEVNIRKDGSLDVADDALAELDVVGAAVHSSFGQPRAAATRRVIRAMESPHVDILFHPTARQIGRREPLDLDIDAVIAAAKRTGTALEIDAMPDRLDLKDEHVRKAVAAGVRLVIDSDAHHPAHLRFADEFGVAVARRGAAGQGPRTFSTRCLRRSCWRRSGEAAAGGRRREIPRSGAASRIMRRRDPLAISPGAVADASLRVCRCAAHDPLLRPAGPRVSDHARAAAGGATRASARCGRPAAPALAHHARTLHGLVEYGPGARGAGGFRKPGLGLSLGGDTGPLGEGGRFCLGADGRRALPECGGARARRRGHGAERSARRFRPQSRRRLAHGAHGFEPSAGRLRGL